MNYTKTNLDVKFDKNYFDLSNNINISKKSEETKTTNAEIEDVIYPLYLPE